MSKLNAQIVLTSPDRLEYTRFERCTDRVCPVHIVQEWQWPGDRAKDQTPRWRTVRISEWRWPLRETYLCDLKPDTDSVNDGWPNPGVRDTRVSLIQGGLIEPWYRHPICNNEMCLHMDDAEYTNAISGGDGVARRNNGLPDDYLDFWLNTDDMED